LDQAQYRELEAFAKFGSDLDAATKSVLNKGVRNVEILKQGQFSPMTVEKQVAIIYLGSKGLLNSIAPEKVRDFENSYLQVLESKNNDILKALKAGKFDDSVTEVLESVAKDLLPSYQS